MFALCQHRKEKRQELVTSQEKYSFCLMTKRMNFVQISGVGLKIVLQW